MAALIQHLCVRQGEQQAPAGRVEPHERSPEAPASVSTVCRHLSTPPPGLSGAWQSPQTPGPSGAGAAWGITGSPLLLA